MAGHSASDFSAERALAEQIVEPYGMKDTNSVAPPLTDESASRPAVDTLTAILNALPVPIAHLDASGVIIAVVGRGMRAGESVGICRL